MLSQSDQRKLELSEFKLNSLLDLTLAINANKSAHELLQKFRDILCPNLNVKRIAVFSVNQDWKKVLSENCSDYFGNNADEISSALLLFKDVSKVNKKEFPLFADFDIIIPVYHKEFPLAFVLLGKDAESQQFGSMFDHLRIIQTLSNIVIVAMENKRLYRKALEQESLKKELEVASNLQAMLIPSADSLPKNNFLHIASFYQPHSMVGGDYYDFMQLRNNEYGFCIADVSGKGISAAILMSNFQANLRILLKRNIPLPNLIRDLNQNVNQNSHGDRFVTFFIAKYNGASKILHYINAGHNPPLLLHKEKSKMVYLTNGCVGLGMLDEIPKITVGTISIDSGDKLLCFTDGLVEAENSEKNEFGTIPIEGSITIEGNADDIVYSLRKELEHFLNGEPTNDDISIMGIDFL